jgi:histidyl-tRNA synthetase
MCVNFGENEAMAAFGLVQFLRKAGIKADLYPTLAKIQKHFKYADKRGVPYVILIGEEELAARSFVVKEMSSGRQNSYSLDTPEEFLKTL